MENVEANALQGWATIYGRELNPEEIREIETNIQKLVDVLTDTERKANG